MACRTSAPKSDLLRFVRSPDGAVWLDPTGGIPSRGSYTCCNASCVRRAVERDGFRRAFDAPVLVGADELVAAASRVLEGEALQALGLLRRTGQGVAGREECLRVHGSSSLRALMIARDLSPRSVREVTSALPAVPACFGPPKEAVGLALGRAPTGVIGLLDGQISRRLLVNLERLNRLLHLDGPPCGGATHEELSGLGSP